MIKPRHLNLAIGLCLILIAVSLRVLPHPANFAPIAAVAIFGGAILPRKFGLWVPLVAMIVSDYLIGFHSLIAVTWGFYVLTALASSKWLKKGGLGTGAALTMGASLSFFGITNFAVWLTSGMYTHTWSGLVQCYNLALPFFRNTFMSDIIFTAVLFGTYALVTKLSQKTLKKYQQA